MIQSLVLAGMLCANPTHEVRVITQVQPQYSSGLVTIPVRVLVRVDIGMDGKLEGAAILQSSGNARIDAAALDAARRSSYAPAVTDCMPAEKSAIVAFDFQNPAAEPSFQPPPNWGAPLRPTVNSVVYRHGTAVISVRMLPTAQTLDQLRIDDMRSLQQLHAKVTVTDVTACRGIPALLFSVSTSGVDQLTSAVFALIDGSAKYEATYVAAGAEPPAPEIIASLESLCPRKTPSGGTGRD